MPVAYSMDLRERVVRAYEAGKGTQSEIAKCFQVSASFVQRLLRRRREGRQLAANKRGGNHFAKIRGEHIAVVKQLVEAQPDAYLYELCEQFKEETGIVVSVTTMHRTMQQLQLSTKKNTARYRTRQRTGASHAS